MKFSNVIDTPRAPGSDDLLGVDRYVDALTQFIEVAQMPTTLAIQGEWGSGKTSLMNQVRHRLCDMGETEPLQKPFFGIWINTWQYAMMRSPEETLINVIQGVTSEVLSIMKRHKGSISGAITKVGGLFGKMVKFGAKAAVTAAGADASLVDELTDSGESTGVASFRKSLSHAISACLEEEAKAGAAKRGFIFFIDDLDRLDPPVAVQILELLKNLFGVENCIFILAIDYDVVVKGLVPKFGPLTEKNEREFRSFFDKIIQLPFSMPVGNYNIDTYLSDSLNEIGYFTPEEMTQSPGGEDSQPVIEYISEMAILSTGSNPRSVKRLINSLSLIKIMYAITSGSNVMSPKEKLLNFGFVCIQIAYPLIYDALLFDPNFKEWSEKTARRFRAAELDDNMREHLAEMEEFDEPWEQVLYRICRNNSYLASRAYNISRLLNLLAKLIGADDNFGEEVSRIMSFAAVTTVSNADDVKVAIGDRNKHAQDIWEEFWDTAEKNPEFKKQFPRKKENPHTWIYLQTGSKGTSLSIDQNRRNNQLMLGLYINNDKALFKKLFKHREEIETAFGGELDWRELPNKKASRVCMFVSFDFGDRASWPEKFTWLAETLVKMREAFANYL